MYFSSFLHSKYKYRALKLKRIKEKTFMFYSRFLLDKNSIKFLNDEFIASI